MKPIEDKKLNKPTKQFFVLIIASVFIVETLIMILFFYVHLSQFIELLADSFLLTFLLSPVLYFFSYRPLIKEHKKVTVAENLLREANAGLENRVADRTKELEESRERFSGLFQLAHEAIVSINTSEKIIFFNKSAENIFGYESTEIVGKSIELLIPERFRRAHAGRVKEFAASPTVSRAMGARSEIAGLRKNGEEFPVEASLIKQNLKGGMVFTAILRDVSERKRAEDTLKASEEKLKQITNAIPSAVYQYSINRQGTQKFLFISYFAETLFGIPAEALQNDFNRAWVLVLPEEAEALWQSIKTATETLKPWSYEFRIKDAHGNLKWIEGHSIPEKPQTDGTIVWNGVFTDITSRKQAERRLHAQYIVSRVLAESHNSDEAIQKIIQVICESLDWQEGAVWNVDTKADVLYCADIWHKPSDSMKEFIDATRRMTFKRNVGLPGRIWESQKPAWILDVLKDNNFPRAPFAAKAGLHSAFGFPIFFENQIIGVMEFFTSEIRSFDDDLLRMMDAIGSQIGQFIQRRQLGEQLFQSQKMETVGTLAGGIAHDLNNQLTPLLGYVDLLLQQTQTGDPAHHLLMEANQAGQRCAEVIQGLLMFSRSSSQRKTILNLGSVLEELKNLLPKFIPSTIALRVDHEKDLLRVEGNGTEIQSVLMNLSVNARDAMPQGGGLSIKARNVDLTNGKAREGYAAGAYVCLMVQDSGTGIPSSLLKKIFEPFFTTKEKGRGTGLGLAMVFNIIKNHKGWIDVSSEVGKGTTFHIYLPALSEDQAQEKNSEEIPASVLQAGNETVLFVDDEENIRNMGRAFLQRLGYRVLLACDGEEAAKQYETHKDEIAVVVLDMTMPKLTGRQTLQKILEMNPKAKIILASGYTSEGSSEELIQEGAADFIQKPYTIMLLSKILRKVIDH